MFSEELSTGLAGAAGAAADREQRRGMTKKDPIMDRPLSSDVDLQRWLATLLREAIRPQLWMIFLDAQSRVVDPLMPMADLPVDPHQRTETEDLGTLPHATALAHRLSMIAELIGATQAVLVWERPSEARLRPDDRAWARAMAEACREVDMPLRAQFLLEDAGVSALAPDDLM